MTKSILVLEDNFADFFLLKETLLSIAELQAYSIIQAGLLEQVTGFDETVRPEIIFVDLKLPDSNGLETFLHVNNKYPLSTIIILSGLEDRSVATQAIQAGAQDYLLKGDFDEKMLLKTILYSIERKQSQLRLKESNLRYELVLKATKDIIWEYNILTHEITWNNNISTFGFPPNTSKDGEWWKQHVHPDDKERVIEKVRTHIIEGYDIWNDSYRFKCYDGSFRHLRNRGYILRTSTNRAYQMIGSIEDITESIELQQKIDTERNQKQKEILQAIITGQEKERNLLGRELHDNINQILAVVKMYLDIAKNNKQQSAFMLEKSQDHVITIIEEIRKLSHTLVAPTLGNASLHKALTILIAELGISNEMHINLAYQNEMALDDKEKELTLYRIVQEQLNNIIKYAKASEINISIEKYQDNVVMIVDDNGIGFDKEKVGFGIGFQNILNRVNALSGCMALESSPGNGCKLQIKLPL